MNKNPLVSICVPVYNVAPYVERCVRSLMEQDYANLEYVFVNDGSTDNSIAVLEQVIEQYPNRKQAVFIYHNDRNHGLAYTRRVTIEKAKGEYCACVDSDDWVDKAYISSMVAQIQVASADIVVTPYMEHRGLRAEAHSSNSESSCIWGKLIKRQLIMQYQCFAPEGLDYSEDRLATLQLRHYAKSISSVNKVFYHYVHQPHSITANKTGWHFECLIRYWEEKERLMKLWDVWEQNVSDCRKEQVADKIALMLQCDSLATRKKYADLFREYELASLKGLSPGFQLMGRLVHHHMWGLIRLYQIYINWLSKRQNR